MRICDHHKCCVQKFESHRIFILFPGGVISIQLQLDAQAHDIQDQAGHVVLRPVPAQPGPSGVSEHVQRVGPRPATRMGHQA